MYVLPSMGEVSVDHLERSGSMGPRISEIVEWLEHGRPSDFVIRKESSHHLANPNPLKDVTKLELGLNALIRFIYPRGERDLEGKTDIYKDMIVRFRSLG